MPNSKWTLQLIEDEWYDPPTHRELQKNPNSKKETLWKDLVSPSERGWFKACQHEITASDGHAKLKAWLDGDPRKNEIIMYRGATTAEMIRLHLAAAQRAKVRWDLAQREEWTRVNPSDPNPNLSKIPEQMRWGRGFFEDLLEELLPEFTKGILPEETVKARKRKPIHSQLITAVFIDGTSDDQGVVAMLTLEMLHEGDGSFYPAPALAFLNLNQAFRDGLDNSYRIVRESLGIWRDGYDVRWRVDLQDDKELPSTLKGGSAGAAFALALAKLFAQEQNSSAVSR